jgi:hypothetical protein
MTARQTVLETIVVVLIVLTWAWVINRSRGEK